MRSLIISCIGILLILAIWLGFMTYTENALSDMTAELNESILPAIQTEQWERASEEFYHFSQVWHDHKKIFDFFLDQSNMAETDFCIARAGACIDSKDLASSASELACVKERLKFLYENEKITIENLL